MGVTVPQTVAQIEEDLRKLSRDLGVGIGPAEHEIDDFDYVDMNTPLGIDSTNHILIVDRSKRFKHHLLCRIRTTIWIRITVSDVDLQAWKQKEQSISRRR